VRQVEAEVGILPRRLSGRAVGVLCRAFAEDPILTHFLGRGARRDLAYRMFFADVVRSSLALGHVHAATSDNHLFGVAVWKPPGVSVMSLRSRMKSALRALVVRALYPRAARELFAGFANLEANHPSVPHWYLMFVGIDPGFQGQGQGAKLLAPVLQLADASGTLCYLETPFRQTHAFYQRLGFQITSESHPFRGAPPLWTMLRQPGRGSV
jgi:ribosomal protein S18 acetylase RimI-like enzyme